MNWTQSSPMVKDTIEKRFSSRLFGTENCEYRSTSKEGVTRSRPDIVRDWLFYPVFTTRRLDPCFGSLPDRRR